jgi:hypothetical protein
MAVTRRTVRLEIERIVFDGLDPGDRRRFERAFRAECDAQLHDVRRSGGLRRDVRLDVTLPPHASPETVAGELARSIVRALDGR